MNNMTIIGHMHLSGVWYSLVTWSKQSTSTYTMSLSLSISFSVSTTCAPIEMSVVRNRKSGEQTYMSI